jgi:tetratricopeptide (TPR) repeat protein
MSTKRKRRIPAGVAVLLGLALASGCGALRSELFRGETAHLLDQGDRHYRSGALQEAGSCYEGAVGLDPACARGHAALGNVAYVRGAFRKAAACYERAASLDPGLETPLAPLILDARRMQERERLEVRGADPHRVHALLTAEREAEVETVLEQGASPAVLARHLRGLPGKDRERLLILAEAKARAGTFPPRCALLYGHLLAVDEHRGFFAARLLEAGAKGVESEAGQKAWVTLGALFVRLGRESDAAWAYEAALEAGCPRDEVVPLLANLYGMPVDAVTSTGEAERKEPKPTGDATPPVLSRGTLSGSLQPPGGSGPAGPVSTSHAAGPTTDRRVVARP